MTSSASIHPNLAINADDLHPVIRDLQAVADLLHYVVFEEGAASGYPRLGYLVERLEQHVAELRKVTRYDGDQDEAEPPAGRTEP
jgi:hypothetical protein